MNIAQKLLKTIGTASAKHATKYSMNAVQLQTKNGRSSAAATDGRIVAKLSWDAAGDRDMDVMLDSKALAAFGKALGKGSEAIVKPRDESVDDSFGKVSVDLSSTGLTMSQTLPQTDGCFPDVDAVLPTDEPKHTIFINPKIFAQLLKAMDASLDPVQPVFRVEFRDANQPLIVRSEGNGITAIGAIMPITGI